MNALVIAVALPVLLVSLTAHELAHGLAADALGDPTPRAAGRLTLNPLRHLDLFGTLVLVLTLVGSGGRFLYGWAKPVPVNPLYFRSQQRGMMLVGAAGPLTNLCVALGAGLLVGATLPLSAVVADVFYIVFLLNTILAMINLLPVPPLDGSRVVGGLLPAKAYERWVSLDRYAMMILVALLAIVMLRPQVLAWYFMPVLRFLSHALLPVEYWIL